MIALYSILKKIRSFLISTAIYRSIDLYYHLPVLITISAFQDFLRKISYSLIQLTELSEWVILDTYICSDLINPIVGNNYLKKNKVKYFSSDLYVVGKFNLLIDCIIC